MNDKETHLVIIGNGELRSQLEEQVREYGLTDVVHFMGDRDDVHNLLASLDYFVLTSITEGFSIALLEACAAGLPVIATNVGGNSEIIRHGETGLLIPSADCDKLVSAMLSLIDNQESAEKLGETAYQWVLEECSADVMYKRYMDIYSV
jgi:glycosyltransferase involved in cell wall biosynthesis